MTRHFLCFLITIAAAMCTAVAQDTPTITPKALYTLSDGETMEDATEPLSAPVHASFTANPEDVDGYEARYEWQVWKDSPNTTPILHRFDEDIEYDFMQSGTYYILLQATFVQGGDTIMLPDESEMEYITLTISESKLEFPNAFSPNGDGYNDVFKAKDTYQSIVEFEATIFNRWGNKIYHWINLAGGWDGRWHGKVVRDGVYFVVVKAKGADGVEYNIRRDVNVLTGTSNNGNNGSGGE